MKSLKKTAIFSALITLCSTAYAQNVLNQNASVQANANFWISGVGKANGGLWVAKDGSDGFQPGVQITNTAETRGANFQLTVGVLPGLATWVHDGTNWVERMRIAPTGYVGIGTSAPTRKFQVLDTSTAVYTPTGASAAPGGGMFEVMNSSPVDGNSATVLITATNSATAKNVAYFSAVSNKDGWTPDIAIGQRIGGSSWVERMRISAIGNVGIGTRPVDSFKLAVNGVIGARRLRVTQASWADFVFDAKYKLPTLDDVEVYVKANGHLKDVPSSAEVTKDGIDVGEMNKILLQKIEEMTLHLIELNKENKMIKERLNALEEGNRK
jgi:hypothetical protein